MPDQHDLPEVRLWIIRCPRHGEKLFDRPLHLGERCHCKINESAQGYQLCMEELDSEPCVPGSDLPAIRAAAVEEERERLLSEKAIEAAKDALKGAPRPGSYLQNHHLRAAMRAALDSDAPEFSCSNVEQRYIEDESKRLGIECGAPPPGWRCTRSKGHDGPCAAIPLAAKEERDG